MLETTALLYKLAPEELPDYGGLRSRKVIDYVPEWKQRMEQAVREQEGPAKVPPPSKLQIEKSRAEPPVYDISDMKPGGQSKLGIEEISIEGMFSDGGKSDDEAEDLLPR